MKRSNGIKFFIPAGSLLVLFILYTAALLSIDRRPIGPQHTLVGFGAFNQRLHHLIGENMLLYNITDWLGLVAIFIAAGFAVLGFVQLIKRKSLLRVDHSILVLGGFYLLVFSGYLFFEYYVVNYRPILINGILEASYPSSTTMLVMCIMPTAMMQFNRLIQNRVLRNGVQILCTVFTAFMVIGRVISGVHWITDIIGGALLSAALVMLYCSANCCIDN